MLGLNIELDLKLFTTAYFSKVFKFSLLLFPGKPLFKLFYIEDDWLQGVLDLKLLIECDDDYVFYMLYF